MSYVLLIHAQRTLLQYFPFLSCLRVLHIISFCTNERACLRTPTKVVVGCIVDSVANIPNLKLKYVGFGASLHVLVRCSISNTSANIKRSERDVGKRYKQSLAESFPSSFKKGWVHGEPDIYSEDSDDDAFRKNGRKLDSKEGLLRAVEVAGLCFHEIEGVRIFEKAVVSDFGEVGCQHS